MNDFITTLYPFAAKHGPAGGILPTLIVAQGILESAGGTSELAREANNLFGIKEGVGWSGPVYENRTQEWSAEKGFFEVTARFRKYESYEGCVIDLVAFYQKPRYTQVRGQTDFLAAATAAWTAGYATDPTYPQKLHNVFVTHDLGSLGEYKEAEVEIVAKEFVVSIGAGHAGFGVTPGKRGPDGKYEWNWNNAVVLAAIEHLVSNYKNVRVIRVDDPTGRTDVGLTARANRANLAKADIHIDVHHNAMGGTWFAGPGGIETFVMQPLSANPSSHRLAKEIHPRIVKAMGLRDRGIKSANFAMLRQTKMPAVLTEGGFMDSRVDRKEMDKPIRTLAQGIAISEGAGAYGSLVKNKVPTPVVDLVKDYFGPGDNGPEIVELQTDLNTAGFKITIDGIYGNATTSAVIAFQKKYKLLPDGYFGKASRNKMNEVLKAAAVPTVQFFRVRESWGNSESQLGAFGDIAGAKLVADLNPGYEVYDDDGRVVYPIVKPAPPAAAKWYRIRLSWADEASQIGAFQDPAQAVAAADSLKETGYEVYGPDGNVFYDPKKPVPPAGKPPKEDDEMKYNAWQRKELAVIFKKAREKGIFDSEIHEKNVLDESKMDGNFITYLIAVIAGANLNDGKRLR